jgi:hypothetical protein
VEVAALRIDFNNGSGYFEPNRFISRIQGDDLYDVATKSLSPGDRIILVDGGARRDLFDVIVEKLEDMPEFAATAVLVQEWHERVRRGALTSGLTYEEILHRMHGTSIISPTTVGSWVRGNVHGPGHAEDIRRFGQAVGDSFLTGRWNSIGQALETMRNHRRRLGCMLARTLAGLSARDLEDEGYFDRRLGIHYSDLTAPVSVHTVSRPAPTTCRRAPVPPAGSQDRAETPGTPDRQTWGLCPS